VVILNVPTSAELKELIKKSKPGYSIIVFIEHGGTQDYKQLFQINKGEIIKAGQLDLEVPKQLYILESCRTDVKNVYTVDLSNKIPKFKYGGMVRMPINAAKSKEFYLEQLKVCGDGIVVCYACSGKEVAMNYFFSTLLLQLAFDWHLDPKPHHQALSIVTLMSWVTPEVSKLSMKTIK